MDIGVNRAVAQGLRAVIDTVDYGQQFRYVTEGEEFVLAQLALCIIQAYCQPDEVVPVGYLRDLLIASGISSGVAESVVLGDHDSPYDWAVF